MEWKWTCMSGSYCHLAMKVFKLPTVYGTNFLYLHWLLVENMNPFAVLNTTEHSTIKCSLLYVLKQCL